MRSRAKFFFPIFFVKAEKTRTKENSKFEKATKKPNNREQKLSEGYVTQEEDTMMH